MLIVNGNNILLNHVIISADYPLKFGYLLQVQYLCTVFFIVLDLRLIKKIGCLG